MRAVWAIARSPRVRWNTITIIFDLTALALRLKVTCAPKRHTSRNTTSIVGASSKFGSTIPQKIKIILRSHSSCRCRPVLYAYIPVVCRKTKYKVCNFRVPHLAAYDNSFTCTRPHVCVHTQLYRLCVHTPACTHTAVPPVCTHTAVPPPRPVYSPFRL